MLSHFLIYISSIKCDEKRTKNHGIAIPALRSEKLFVQENKLQMKTEVVRNSVCEQSEIFLNKCFYFCII